MFKGSVKERVDIWRGNVLDYTLLGMREKELNLSDLEGRAHELSQRERDLRAALSRGENNLQGGALRSLRRILARMIQGEMAFTLTQWKEAKQAATDAAERERLEQQAALARALLKKSTALKDLCRIMQRLIKGLIGVCVQDWKAGALDDGRMELETALNLLEEKRRNEKLDVTSALKVHGQQRAGTCLLRHVVVMLTVDGIKRVVSFWHSEAKSSVATGHVKAHFLIEMNMQVHVTPPQNLEILKILKISS